MTELPVDSFKDASPHLRRPFTATSVRWKQQATLSGGRCLIVPYIDARLVVDRLNRVCPHLWEDATVPYGDRIDSGHMVCTLEIDGLSHSDVGQGQGPQKAKAAYSDSLKRVAVRVGIGISLYSVPKQILGSSESGEIDSNGRPTLRRAKNKKGEEQMWLTPECERYLAEQYQEWLEEHGIKAFGEPLDHGDTAESVGALLDDLPDEPAQEDLELAAKREEVEQLYDEKIAKGNGTKSKFPKGQFTAQLRQADSPDKLAEIVQKIEKAAA